VYKQQQEQQEQQDAENPFLDPPFSRIKNEPSNNGRIHGRETYLFQQAFNSVFTFNYADSTYLIYQMSEVIKLRNWYITFCSERHHPQQRKRRRFSTKGIQPRRN
jgi:hypothetical protein